MSRNIVVMGDCQTGGVAAALSLMLPADAITGEPWSRREADSERIVSALRGADVVVTSIPRDAETVLRARGHFPDVPQLRFPRILFRGFHPDIIVPRIEGKAVRLLGVTAYHSATAVWCWRAGLDLERTRTLFTARTFERLGYTRCWRQETARLRARFMDSDLAFADVFLPLQASGQVFMHTVNHPRIDVLVQVARGLARALGAPEDMVAQPVERMIPDALAAATVWPVYPGVAEHLGVRGDSVWRMGNESLSLDDFLALQFRVLDQVDGPVDFDVVDTPGFDAAMRAACDETPASQPDEDPWRRASSRLRHPSI